MLLFLSFLQASLASTIVLSRYIYENPDEVCLSDYGLKPLIYHVDQAPMVHSLLFLAKDQSAWMGPVDKTVSPHVLSYLELFQTAPTYMDGISTFQVMLKDKKYLREPIGVYQLPRRVLCEVGDEKKFQQFSQLFFRHAPQE